MLRLLLALAFATTAVAQSDVTITLAQPRPVTGADVTVSRVLDLRADTTTVGEAMVGITNRRRPVRLAGGAEAALIAYLTAALPEGDGREPVVVAIDRLLVGERAGISAETGRADVLLRWFRQRDGGLVEIGQSGGMTEGRGLDVTAGHDDRLADAIDQAIRAFLDSEREESAGAPIAAGTLPPRRTYLPILTTAPAVPATHTFIVGGPVVGTNATGGRLAFGLRPVTDAAWSFPLLLEASVVKTNGDDGLEGVFSTYGGSIQAARRLGQSQAFIQPGIQISGGNETIGQESSFFFGGRASLDLVRYPADKGLVAGIGVYGSRLFGSQVYPRDVGVAVTVGGQF